MKGYAGIIEALINANADIDSQTNDGKTALIFGIETVNI